ncbi:Uroporphyrinogen-III C-methyltransferase [bacterium HR29]|jgi:uroporphyrinogen III methyltransferase/synthase|nr:Uroporphyrinogen-III C-methyltransferase [bacterium HR29]
MRDAGGGTLGRVWLVGAGPGDPGLLTLAGREALERADVVLFDALVDERLLQFARPEAERLFVGKRAGEASVDQQEIEALMVRLAKEGKRVVRLKGGDPFVFGRGGEEALALRKAGVPFTVVPGVTSAIAAPAYAGIPVTHRGLAASVFIATGSRGGDEARAVDWRGAAAADTVVVLMGGLRLEAIAEAMIAAGKTPATPAAVIQWGTRSDQRVVRGTLATIAADAARAELGTPALLVVGEVVRLGEELAWFVPGPLAGVRVAVTRSRTQSSELRERLERLGARVIEAPAIRVRYAAEEVAAALEERWEWIALTSQNAVEALWLALESGGHDARRLAGVGLAAVGAATAHALTARGLRADFVADGGTARSLAAALPLREGDRVLYPASSEAGDELEKVLRDRGAYVWRVVAYRPEPAPLDETTLAAVREADVITFTSGSTARFLARALGGAPLPEHVRLVSIGPSTSAVVAEVFGRVDAQAREPTLDALVEAVCEAAPWG